MGNLSKSFVTRAQGTGASLPPLKTILPSNLPGFLQNTIHTLRICLYFHPRGIGKATNTTPIYPRIGRGLLTTTSSAASDKCVQ